MEKKLLFRELYFPKNIREILLSNNKIHTALFDAVKERYENFFLPRISNGYEKNQILEKFSNAKTLEELPVIRVYHDWETTIADRRMGYINPTNENFLMKILINNLDKMPLEEVFYNDIIKIDNEYYQKPIRFQVNEDTQYQKDDCVSMWHNSLDFARSNYDFTIITKDTNYDVLSLGQYGYSWESYCGEEYGYKTELIPEYVFKQIVKIDFALTKQLYDFEKTPHVKNIFDDGLYLRPAVFFESFYKKNHPNHKFDETEYSGCQYSYDSDKFLQTYQRFMNKIT